MLFGGQTRPPKGNDFDRVELVEGAPPSVGVDEEGFDNILFKLGPPVEQGKCVVEHVELVVPGCSFGRSVGDKNWL